MWEKVRGLWFLLVGLATGAFFGSGVAKRWGANVFEITSSSNFITLLAGLGGAVVGGAFSYWIAKEASKLTLKRDQEARTAGEHAQALNVIVTTAQLSNRLFTLNKNLQSAIPSEAERPWQKLQASPEDDAIRLSYASTDFIPFINARRGDLVHRAYLLADRVRSLDVSYRTYGRLRLELEQFMLPHSVFQDGAMVTDIPPELQTSAIYRMKQLDSLTIQMQEFCSRDLEDAKSILQDMNEAYLAYFGEKALFKITVGDSRDTI